MYRTQLYNQILNFFWTGIAFAPVLGFWIKFWHPLQVYLGLSLSLVPFFLPLSFFAGLQLSKNRRFYEKLGIRKVQALAQHGAMVNKLLARQQKGYKVLNSRMELPKLRAKMLVYEKFHAACFVFFTLSCGAALFQRQWWLTLLLLVANLIYNVYPLLLQQYNRLRFPGPYTNPEQRRYL